ncbi:MAG: AraC family transcriptional regulator, partial [Puia sp.]
VELQINSRAGDEIVYGNRILPVYQKHCLVGSTPIATFSPFGDMLFQHFPGTGFDIWYSVYAIRTPVTLVARADLAVLELHIPFKRQMRAKWDGIVHTVMEEKQFDLSFAPFVHNEATFEQVGEYHTFDVHYHKETLQQFAPYFPMLSVFLEKVEKAVATSLLGSTRFLSPGMIRVVNEMLRYDFLESMAPAFYESKAMELLILMLRNISGVQTAVEKFSRVSIEYAQAAKALILSDFEHQYTATELARKTGTNVFTLKTAFKNLFGCSLFRFGEEMRMDRARQLLLEGKQTVSEIAWLTGYPDVHNFSTAFKRHFGYRPTETRRNGN